MSLTVQSNTVTLATPATHQNTNHPSPKTDNGKSSPNLTIKILPTHYTRARMLPYACFCA